MNCDHLWTDYATLKSGDNPTIEIEACVHCGVQRKKQPPKMRIIITLPLRVVTVLVPAAELAERLGTLLADYGIHCHVKIECVQ